MTTFFTPFTCVLLGCTGVSTFGQAFLNHGRTFLSICSEKTCGVSALFLFISASFRAICAKCVAWLSSSFVVYLFLISFLSRQDCPLSDHSFRGGSCLLVWAVMNYLSYSCPGFFFHITLHFFTAWVVTCICIINGGKSRSSVADKTISTHRRAASRKKI